MPISRDQFEHLRDFSGLENLHVYGDLLNLHNLPVSATIGEAGRLHDEINDFEMRLLTVYVSYVLAHKGYYVKTFAGDEFAELGGRLYTTRFNSQDWVDNFHLFLPGGEPFIYGWEEDYENRKGEKIRIVFATLLLTEMNYKTGEELDEAQYLIKHFDDESTNFAVVHPRLSRQAKKTFLNAKEKMKEYTGKDLLLSTGEFAPRIIPNKEERYVIDQNWISLRESLLRNLQKDWPILVYAIQQQKIADIQEKMRRAGIRHETNEFDRSIEMRALLVKGSFRFLTRYTSQRN